MRTLVALGAVVAVLGTSLPADAQFQLGRGGRGIYVSPQGGINLGYGGGGYVNIGQGGGVRVGLPARIQNRLANHYVQRPLPAFGYGAPGYGAAGYGAYPGYYPQQPYYWYSYRYFPVANSSLFAPSSMYPYGYKYNPSSGYADYYTPPYDLPGAAAAPGGASATGAAAPGGAGLPAGPALPARPALPGGAPPPSLAPGPGGVPAVPPAEATFTPRSPRDVVRTSTPEARRRAALLAEAGDALFRKQRYYDALSQYRTAARIAPDVGNFFLRQGFAQIAARNYEAAADAFKRALSLDPDLAEAKLRLETLYGDARLAKHAHLDALATTALDKSNNADLLFVLGMFLHYDGQADRAQKFFERADKLAAPHDDYLRPFLASATGGTRT